MAVVVNAVLWLLPFAYMAAVYALVAVVSLTWLYCCVCSIVAAAVCLHVCKVCSVVAAALYLTQYMATWLYCLQRDGLGQQSNDTACHVLF
jgi:hypothetical protein